MNEMKGNNNEAKKQVSLTKRLVSGILGLAGLILLLGAALGFFDDAWANVTSKSEMINGNDTEPAWGDNEKTFVTDDNGKPLGEVTEDGEVEYYTKPAEEQEVSGNAEKAYQDLKGFIANGTEEEVEEKSVSEDVLDEQISEYKKKTEDVLGAQIEEYQNSQIDLPADRSFVAMTGEDEDALATIHWDSVTTGQITLDFKDGNSNTFDFEYDGSMWCSFQSGDQIYMFFVDDTVVPNELNLIKERAGNPMILTDLEWLQKNAG